MAAELDKDAQELQASLTAGKLPPWVGGKDDEAAWE